MRVDLLRELTDGDYPRGRIAVIPGREQTIDLAREDWSMQEQFEHELLGRSMFYNKTRGTCTSSAMALTTVLRAVGIPTRMVLAIPIVDGSDEAQVAMVKDLTNHQVRRNVLEGISSLGSAFASHTFNEVFVGGRWQCHPLGCASRTFQFGSTGHRAIQSSCQAMICPIG